MDHVQWTKLYERYATDVFRFAFVLVREHHLAQDVMQETFVKALRHGESLRDSSKSKAWILSIARNTAYDFLQKQSREIPSPNEIFEKLPMAEKPAESFCDLIGCLDEEDRLIVTLHIVNGLKHREIAVVTGLVPTVVRKRYSRAIAEIRDDLNGKERLS